MHERSTLRPIDAAVIALHDPFMLLVSAGLLVEAFRKVLHVDPGFRPDNVITYRINLPAATYKKNEEKAEEKSKESLIEEFHHQSSIASRK